MPPSERVRQDDTGAQSHEPAGWTSAETLEQARALYADLEAQRRDVDRELREPGTRRAGETRAPTLQALDTSG